MSYLETVVSKMAEYSTMRDSGIDWIRMIPGSWQIERGKNILQLLDRPTKDDDEIITCFRDGEVTLRKNRREQGFTNSLKEVGYQGIEPGDLVVHGMDGFAGSIGISDSRGKATPVLIVLDSTQNKKYIMYYLRALAYRDVFMSLSTGIRVRSCDLRWNKLANLPFILPSETEQSAIAAYLDDQCAKIDALIEEAKASIEEYKHWKASLIFEAVTKGLDPNIEMKASGNRWMGHIPKEWHTCKTLYVLSMAITDGPHTTPELFDNGVPFISAEAVSCGNGSIDFSHKRGYISEEFYQECCKKYVPQRNDIYMIKSGATTGRVSMVETDERFTIWSPLAVFRTDPNRMYPRYLFYFLQSDAYQKQVELGWTYGTQQNIGMRTLEQLKLCVPPMNTQIQIAKYLDNNCTAINSLIDNETNLINDLEDYKKSLIFETVTGKRKVV